MTGQNAVTPEQRHLIDVGVDYFRRMVPADAPLGYQLIPEDNAVAVYHDVRGGGTIFVGPDETVLFSSSSAPFEEAVKTFRSGHRTPPEHFRPADSGR